MQVLSALPEGLAVTLLRTSLVPTQHSLPSMHAGPPTRLAPRMPVQLFSLPAALHAALLRAWSPCIDSRSTFAFDAVSAAPPQPPPDSGASPAHIGHMHGDHARVPGYVGLDGNHGISEQATAAASDAAAGGAVSLQPGPQRHMHAAPVSVGQPGNIHAATVVLQPLPPGSAQAAPTSVSMQGLQDSRETTVQQQPSSVIDQTPTLPLQGIVLEPPTPPTPTAHPAATALHLFPHLRNVTIGYQDLSNATYATDAASFERTAATLCRLPHLAGLTVIAGGCAAFSGALVHGFGEAGSFGAAASRQLTSLMLAYAPLEEDGEIAHAWQSGDEGFAKFADALPRLTALRRLQLRNAPLPSLCVELPRLHALQDLEVCTLPMSRSVPIEMCMEVCILGHKPSSQSCFSTMLHQFISFRPFEPKLGEATSFDGLFFCFRPACERRSQIGMDTNVYPQTMYADYTYIVRIFTPTVLI